MGFQDDLLTKFEASGGSRWLLVALGVIVLLRLKLVLFAASLPVVAYWLYSKQDAAASNQFEGDQDGGGADAAANVIASGDPGNGGKGGSAWDMGDDEDDDAIFRNDDAGEPAGDNREGRGDGSMPDPYDQSFWGEGGGEKAGGVGGSGGGGGEGDDSPAPKAKTDRLKGSWDIAGDDDFFPVPGPAGGSAPQKKADPLAEFNDKDDLDGLFGGSSLKDPLGGFGGGMGGMGGFGGGMDDDDLFGGGFGGGFGGKGKGKGGGKGKKGGKDFEKGPREADPKQVFVANVGDLSQLEIRTIFEEVGDITRLKVLEKEDGSSKGVCFVTFSSEQEAEDAIQRLHGKNLGDRSLVVRSAHAGSKGEKGEKGDKGGGRGGFGGDRDRGGFGGFGGDRDRDRGGFGDRDRDRGGFGDRDRDRGGFGDRDLGGSDRFASAFGDRGDRDRGGGKGKGGGKRSGDRGEVEDLLKEMLAGEEGPLMIKDFDFPARRFLGELRSRDKAEGTERFREALDMVVKYSCTKERDDVRKWPAYVFTLLHRFDPDLSDELRERDMGRRNKGGGGRNFRDD